MLKMVVTGLAVVSGLASAGFWFWSAWLKFPAPAAYLSGAPDEVVDRIDFICRLNSIAAGLSGVTVLIGAIGNAMA